MRGTILTAIIALSLLLTFPNRSFGEAAPSCTITEMYIAGIPVEEISGNLTITRDWLEKGEIVIEGEAPPQAEKVEVTLDGGKTWHEAQDTPSWFYSFQPLPGEQYRIGARAWCKGKPAPAHRKKFYKAHYTSKTSREIVAEKLHQVELFYQGKNRLQFMTLFSKRLRSPLYSNYRDLEVQVRNDFQWGGAIQYHFYIDQILRTDGIYIVQTHWDMTYVGLMEPKEGYTEFHFDPGNGWKVADIRGDKPFGIIEEPKPDLYIVEDEIKGEFPQAFPTGTVIVPVHNGGRVSARKVVVKIYCMDEGGFGYPPSAAKATSTVKTIPIMGTRIVTFVLQAGGGFGAWNPPVTCIIIVDPKNRVSEINEDDNRAQKVF